MYTREEIAKVEAMRDRTAEIAIKSWKALAKRKKRAVVASQRGTHNWKVQVLRKDIKPDADKLDLGVGLHHFILPSGKMESVWVTK